MVQGAIGLEISSVPFEVLAAGGTGLGREAGAEVGAAGLLSSPSPSSLSSALHFLSHVFAWLLDGSSLMACSNDALEDSNSSRLNRAMLQDQMHGEGQRKLLDVLDLRV